MISFFPLEMKHPNSRRVSIVLLIWPSLLRSFISFDEHSKPWKCFQCFNLSFSKTIKLCIHPSIGKCCVSFVSFCSVFSSVARLKSCVSRSMISTVYMEKRVQNQQTHLDPQSNGMKWNVQMTARVQKRNDQNYRKTCLNKSNINLWKWSKIVYISLYNKTPHLKNRLRAQISTIATIRHFSHFINYTEKCAVLLTYTLGITHKQTICTFVH